MSIKRLTDANINMPSFGVLILVMLTLVVASALACNSDDDPTPVSTATSVPQPTSAPAAAPTDQPTSTSLSEASSGASTSEKIKIGTLMDQTGDLGIFGPPMIKAVDLVAEIVNESGGLNGAQVEFVHRDSRSSEQLGVDAASALVNIDGVKAIIGSLGSGITLAIAESVAIPSGVLLISPTSSSPAISVLDDDDLVFRTVTSDAFQGVVLADLASELGYSSAVTVYINNAYGEGLSRSFSARFEEIGGTIHDQVGFESGQVSYISELKRAADSGGQLLLTVAYPDSEKILLRESAEADFFDDYLFVDVAASDGLFDGVDVSEFEGSYGTIPNTPDNPLRRAFTDLYATRTDGNPDDIFISEAFDAAVIVALAIEKADSDDPNMVKMAMRDVANPPGEIVGPGDLPKALELIRNGQDVNYSGAAGEQDFDENGDVVTPIDIWRISNGEIVDTGIYITPGETLDLSQIQDQDTSNETSDTPSGGAMLFNIGSGSQGLFKVDETLRGLDIVVSLETNALTGSIDLDSGTADVEIDLQTLTSDQSRRDRYVRERMFPSQPVATVRFDSLGEVPDSFFSSGEELTTTLTATVNVNGVDADLDFDITARLDNGESLWILGTAQFVWADFGMTAPASGFYTVEDEVTVEILLQAQLAN